MEAKTKAQWLKNWTWSLGVRSLMLVANLPVKITAVLPAIFLDLSGYVLAMPLYELGASPWGRPLIVQRPGKVSGTKSYCAYWLDSLVQGEIYRPGQPPPFWVTYICN